MEEERNCVRAHVLVLPFPGQGHIKPMLNLSINLACKGVKVTLATPLYITKSVEIKDSTVVIESYSDGCDEGGIAEAGSLDAYMDSFKDVGTKNISKLIERHEHSTYPVRCLIYSAVLPFLLDIAKRHDLIGASFYTQSCTVNAIYFHAHQGTLITPVQQQTVSLPGLPLLRTQELPSFVHDKETDSSVLQFLLDQFSNVDKTDFLLFNTFDMLEDQVVNWMAEKWPEKMITIGPAVPSFYMNNGVEDGTHNLRNLINADLSSSIKWLNTKETGSVVFVSFGTIARLGENQIEELAWGLKRSNKYFLWVVRDSEEHKLPIKFKDEMSEKGLVVSWCPQLEVLAHQALGCFVTHCGWNSTTEALSLGVPMVAIPQWIDQPTNAKFIEDVWRVGVRAKVDEKGIVISEEIENCIWDVMHGDRWEEIKRNAIRWKKLAMEAVGEGGSSDKNIDTFISRLVCTR
ncbi:hypothetical protein IFM89_009794 [Coptis chinensis]|uniref:Glycosyltransferase n=1 Tax=Coptis chinensis TaxID=261450 RepID=A0A835I3G7_9MAGN|nr:hypothetical protein IFM89_009794 [Coptis chinensis]